MKWATTLNPIYFFRITKWNKYFVNYFLVFIPHEPLLTKILSRYLIYSGVQLIVHKHFSYFSHRIEFLVFYFIYFSVNKRNMNQVNNGQFSVKNKKINKRYFSVNLDLNFFKPLAISYVRFCTLPQLKFFNFWWSVV